MTTLHLDITLVDFNAFQREVCAPSRRERSLAARAAPLGIWLLCVATFTVLFSKRWVTMRDLAAGCMTLAAVAALTGINIARKRARLAPEPAGTVLGAVQLTFSETGIDATARLYQTHMSWAAVRRLRETATHLFLMVDTTAGYIIPKRSVGDEGKVSALRAEIARWVPSSTQ